MRLSGGGVVAKTLKQFGVRHLFSLPGHQTLSVFDGCLNEQIDLISTRHEAAAVFMAQGISFATRQPGVALLAGGPELTNSLTAIAQAYYANTPLVIIAGANTLQKRDKGFPQDFDQLQVVRPFTKWARSCHDVRRIPEYIATAYRYALRGRPGPTYVEIPYDLMEAKVASSDLTFPKPPSQVRACGERHDLEEMSQLLVQARRPVAIAGSGALWSGAEAELLDFVEKTRVPLFLVSAALAMPFPIESTWGMGGLGVSRPATKAITEADLILLLGTRLNFTLGFGQAPFFTQAQKIIQIDIEAEEMGANRRPDLEILGDLQATLQVFNSLDLSLPDLSEWRTRLRDEIDRYQLELDELASSTQTPLHPLRLVTELEAARTDDSILVLDGANSILWALMVYKAKPQGGTIISTLGELQAIGAGVPQALALKRFFPERQVMLHTGDGSLGYGMMEMETAVRYGIPLVVIVHNDSGWGMTRDMQSEFFGKERQLGNQLGLVRYDQVVTALGGYGELVERPDDFTPALRRALEAGKPALINVMVDPRPKSPGLMTFMMMEVMLGKETYYDRIPDWVNKLGALGLDEIAARLMRSVIDQNLHHEIK